MTNASKPGAEQAKIIADKVLRPICANCMYSRGHGVSETGHTYYCMEHSIIVNATHTCGTFDMKGNNVNYAGNAMILKDKFAAACKNADMSHEAWAAMIVAEAEFKRFCETIPIQWWAEIFKLYEG